MQRSGTADLPLHGGRVPAWLAEGMTHMGTAIAEAIVYNCGRPNSSPGLATPSGFRLWARARHLAISARMNSIRQQETPSYRSTEAVSDLLAPSPEISRYSLPKKNPET